MVISHSYVQQNQRVLAQAKRGHASKYGYLSFCWILKLTQRTLNFTQQKIRFMAQKRTKTN